MDIKVNTESVDKEHRIYIGLSNGNIVAITGNEQEKIEKAHQEYKENDKIPDELIVQGRLLSKNQAGVFEDRTGVLHEYKIKDLKFASSKIEWQ
jgi:hypothetical protein